jgi:hypothetical protein
MPVPLRSPRTIALLVAGLLVAGCVSAGPAPTPIYITPSPTPTPAVTASPTAEPTLGPCQPSQLHIVFVAQDGYFWQAGAGSQMATLELTNIGTAACTIKAKSQPFLLNGDGTVLIAGDPPEASTTLTVIPGGRLRTMVQTGNLCGAPDIVAPTTVAFILPGVDGMVKADPISDTDTGGVPACMGDPSVHSGGIGAHDWAAP